MEHINQTVNEIWKSKQHDMWVFYLQLEECMCVTENALFHIVDLHIC